MNKKALCIGISDFQDAQINRLPGCVNDAVLLADTLKTQYGFSADNTCLLLNEQATKAGIVERLKWLVNGSGSGDVLVLTVASHGTWTLDTSGDEDAAQGRDEVLVTYDYDLNQGNGLIDDELGAILDRVPAGARLYCIIDTCCSGTATRQTLERVPSADKPINRFLPPSREILDRFRPAMRWRSQLVSQDDNMNRISISGCTDDEESLDYPAPIGNQGLMTYSLHQALQASNWQGTVADIFQTVQQNVSRAAKKYRAVQTPQLHGPEALRNAQLFR